MSRHAIGCAAAAATLAVTTLIGCSPQQAYGAGQAWQREECSKLLDAQDRERCIANASTSYEEYKRQVESAKGTK